MSSIPPPQAIKAALSAPRFSTFEAATTVIPALSGAITLYTWNAQLSAALMFPLHVYGPDWPRSQGFLASLTDPPHPTYSPKRDLLSVGWSQATTGNVIAELKFKFWETMFTGRFDLRLWNPHLRNVLPFIEAALTVQQARKRIRDDLESLRLLRNRIAHHEPIFTRDLAGDFQKAHELIAFRCVHTAAWMHANEAASVLIAAKPP